MSGRIAEFDFADDALLFAKMKNRLCGSDDYDVCSGIQKMYAVMPKLRTPDPDEAYEDFREDEANER